MDGFYILGYRDYLTDKEQNDIWDWQRRHQEHLQFKKAAKIKWKDWKGEMFFDGNNFHVEIDDHFENMIDAYGFNFSDWIDYVWATEPKSIISSKDAYDIYENDLVELEDPDEYQVYGVEQLQKSLDKFVEDNVGNVAYHIDYGTAILIHDEIAEYQKQHDGET